MDLVLGLDRHTLFLYANLAIKGLLPVIVIPLGSSFLEASAFGTLTAYFSVAVIAGFICDYSLNVYGTTELAQLPTDKKSHYIVNLTALKIILGAVLLLVMPVFIGLLKIEGGGIISLLTTIIVVASIFDCNWIFFECKRFDLLFSSALIGLVLGITLPLAFQYSELLDSEMVVALLLSAPLLCMNVASFFFLAKQRLYSVNISRFIEVKVEAIRKAFVQNFVIFSSQIVSAIYSNFASIALVSIGKPELAAVWFALNRLCSAIGTLSLVPLRSCYPDVVRTWTSPKNEPSNALQASSLKFGTIVFCAIFLLGFLPENLLVFIFIDFGLDYFLLVMLLIFGWMQINGPVFTGFYISKNRRNFVLLHTFLAFLILIIFYYPLTEAYGLHGWVLSIILSQIFIFYYTSVIIIRPNKINA